MNPLVFSEAGQPGRHALGRCALSVNVNRVALLRNSRPVGIPDVVRLSSIALEAGADGITVHPRPDARHITTQDVRDLSQLMKRWPQAEYNLEGNPFHNLMDLVREVRPPWARGMTWWAERLPVAPQASQSRRRRWATARAVGSRRRRCGFGSGAPVTSGRRTPPPTPPVRGR